MRYLLKLLFVVVSIASALNGAQARSGLITFSQPDGSEFEGYLRGDPAFHWIESNGEIVLYNNKDGYYYNVIINSNSSVEFTTNRPPKKVSKDTKQTSFQTTSVSSTVSHSVSRDSREKLLKLQKKSKEGHRPK